MSGVYLTRRGLLLFASMSLIWGIPYFFIRIAVSELSPATLVFMRTTLAALVLLPFALARGGGFAVAFLLFFALITEIGPVRHHLHQSSGGGATRGLRAR
ncbi:MAG: EamA family transporter [Candidatus Dormibacter sp.]|uniref:EamA family transporter n=1 Tax=Candidatus Dormibacter sp. TaxID=2973982 RepID=UPI0026BA7DC6